MQSRFLGWIIVLSGIVILTGFTAWFLFSPDSPLGDLIDDLQDVDRLEEPLGSRNADILQGQQFEHILIEVDYVAGREPDPQARSTLHQRIDTYSEKQTIEIVLDDELTGGQTSYSLEDIRDLERTHRGIEETDDTIVLYLLYLDGEFDEDSNVLGIAYSGTSMILFKDRIQDAATLNVDATDVEETVLVHEWGHLLGLVNIGYTSEHDHQTDDGTHHCNHVESTIFGDRYDCVMAPGVDTADFFAQIEGDVPDDFQEHCQDDIQSILEGTCDTCA